MTSALLISLCSVLVSLEKKSGWFSLRSGTAQFDQVLNVDEQGSRTPQSILLFMSAFGCSISECNSLENYNFCYLEKKTQTC